MSKFTDAGVRHSASITWRIISWFEMEAYRTFWQIKVAYAFLGGKINYRFF